MNPDVWGVFHDGVITRLTGAVPGTLVLRVEIGYLRAMFDGTGTDFQVELGGCSKLRYNEYDEAPSSDLLYIEGRQPEILYVATTDPLVLDCVMGTLEMTYRDLSIFLDTGVPVSYDELVQACDQYWTRWQQRGPTA